MSNRGAHVQQDSFVIERRLRPIYDWLDAGSYKKAIQECDKVLKKSNQLYRVKALKALALLRLGREAECVQMLDMLSTMKHTDDATLQAMSMCYREMQQLDQVCKLYEDAVKEEPTNEELHSHLFMSYVRMSNYKSQQQSAMQLYKLQPKKPYYCWAIMSIILQAQRGDGAHDDKKRTLLLSLAERMIDKMIQENKMEAEPVQLYIIILEALNKHAKIIDVLDGPLGAKLQGEMVHNKLPYLIKLSQWPQVNLMCKKMLLESMDRWDIWKYYINSVFEIKDCMETAVDDTPQKAHEFICRLLDSGSGLNLRGPFLARFELAKQLVQRGRRESSLLGDVNALLEEYFGKFGHKPCCVNDLRGYLDLLPCAARLAFARHLAQEVGIGADGVPQSEQQMQRHICVLQLSRLCGAHQELSYEQAAALVTALACHYLPGYQTYGKDVLSTEQGPADAYILLAAHLLFDLHVRSETTRPLVLALVLLASTLKNSPCNFHIKLLMLKIYHILGCCSEAQIVYESLDIKHLQLDSMCHVHCAHLSMSGHYTLAHSLFDTTLKFFSANYKDSSEHLTFSYKFGSFVKLTEFMDFREQMNNSFHYTCIAVDKMFLGHEQCATIEGMLELDAMSPDQPVLWAQIRDNSDLSVYVSWDPERIAGPLEKWSTNAAIYEQDVHLLKVRVSVLYCINIALQLCRHEAKDKDLAQLAEEVERLAQLAKEIEAKNYQPVKQATLSMSLPSRLDIYQKTSYHHIVLNAFRIVLLLDKDKADECAALVETIKTAYNNLALFIAKLMRGENGASNGKRDPFLHNRTNIQFLCNYVEITTVLVLVLYVCLEQTCSGGRGKKKKQIVNGKSRQSVLALGQSITSDIRDVDNMLDEVAKPRTIENNEQATIRDVYEKLSALNISTGDEDVVVDALNKSNETALKEIRSVLNNKLRLLTSLSKYT